MPKKAIQSTAARRTRVLLPIVFLLMGICLFALSTWLRTEPEVPLTGSLFRTRVGTGVVFYTRLDHGKFLFTFPQSETVHAIVACEGPLPPGYQWLTPAALFEGRYTMYEYTNGYADEKNGTLPSAQRWMGERFAFPGEANTLSVFKEGKTYYLKADADEFVVFRCSVPSVSASAYMYDRNKIYVNFNVPVAISPHAMFQVILPNNLHVERSIISGNTAALYLASPSPTDSALISLYGLSHGITGELLGPVTARATGATIIIPPSSSSSQGSSGSSSSSSSVSLPPPQSCTLHADCLPRECAFARCVQGMCQYAHEIECNAPTLPQPEILCSPTGACSPRPNHCETAACSGQTCAYTPSAECGSSSAASGNSSDMSASSAASSQEGAVCGNDICEPGEPGNDICCADFCGDCGVCNPAAECGMSSSSASGSTSSGPPFPTIAPGSCSYECPEGEVIVGFTNSWPCPGLICSGSSCPYVSSWTGTGYVLEHEAIPFSFMPGLEDTTHQRLDALSDADAELRLRIAEERDEISYVNEITLTAAAKPLDAGYAVTPDINGRLRTLRVTAPPIRCETSEGDDCLADVTSADDRYATNDPYAVHARGGDLRNWTDLTFAQPDGAADDVKLFLNAETHPLMDGMAYRLIVPAGRDGFSVANAFFGLPILQGALQNFFTDNGVYLNVEVWNGKTWDNRGVIKTGNYRRWDDILVSIDTNDLPEGPLKIRLSSDAWYLINRAGIDASDDAPIETEKLSFASRDDGASYGDFADRDDRYLQIAKGHHVDVSFVRPVAKEGMTYDYVVSLTGYYEPTIPDMPTARWRETLWLLIRVLLGQSFDEEVRAFLNGDYQPPVIPR